MKKVSYEIDTPENPSVTAESTLNENAKYVFFSQLTLENSPYTYTPRPHPHLHAGAGAGWR